MMILAPIMLLSAAVAPQEADPAVEGKFRPLDLPKGARPASSKAIRKLVLGKCIRFKEIMGTHECFYKNGKWTRSQVGGFASIRDMGVYKINKNGWCIKEIEESHCHRVFKLEQKFYVTLKYIKGIYVATEFYLSNIKEDN